MTFNLDLRKTDGILIIGKRGSGKTYLSAWIMQNYPFRYVVLDPTGSYRGYSFRREAYFEIDPLDPRVENIVRAAMRHGYFVVVDEADEFPYAKYSAIRTLVLRGRNWGSGYMFITHTPALISTSVMANST